MVACMHERLCLHLHAQMHTSKGATQAFYAPVNRCGYIRVKVHTNKNGNCTVRGRVQKLECSHAQQKRQGRSANCSPYRKLHQLVDLVPPQSIPEGEALELDDQGVGQPPHGHLLTGLPLLLTAGAVPANTTSRSGNSSSYAHRGMLFSRLNTCTLHLSHRHLLTGLSLLLTAGAVPAKTTSRAGNSSRHAHRGSRFHTCTHTHMHTHTCTHHT